MAINSYRPWTYTDRRTARNLTVQRFQERAQRRDEYRPVVQSQRGAVTSPPPAAPAASQPKKKKGWLDKLGDVADAVTPDFAVDAVKNAGMGALIALDAPGRYVARPAIKGLTGFDAQKYVDDRSNPAFLRILLDRATDPLTYIAPGAAAKALTLTPKAIQASKGAKWAAAIASTPRTAAIGGSLGAAAAGQLAQSTDAPGWAQIAYPIAGGLAGATAASRVAARGLRQVGRDIATGNEALNRAAARIQGREGQMPAVGLGLDIVDDAMPEGMAFRPQSVPLRHESIKTRPQLFQAQDVAPGEAVDPKRVQRIVDNFNPAKLEEGVVVRDIRTGEYTVLGGHHRLAAMTEANRQGRFGDTMTWRVIDADLDNPNHLRYLRDYAVTHNYTQAAKNIRADINAYRVLAENGDDDTTIARKLNRPRAGRPDADGRASVQDIGYLAELPADVLDRIVLEPKKLEAAAAIGRAKKMHGLTDADARGLFNRFQDSQLTRTQLNDRLDALGLNLEVKRQQGDMGDVFGDNLVEKIDRVKSIEDEIAKNKADLASLDTKIAKYAKKNPAAAEAAAKLRDSLADDIRMLEVELDGIRDPARAQSIVDQRLARKAEANRPAPDTGRAGDPGAGGVARAVTGDESGVVVGARVRTQGLEGEVVDVRNDAILIRTAGGREEWAPTQADLFGESPRIEVITSQPRMAIDAAAGRAKPPKEQGGLPLPDESVPARAPEPPAPQPERIPRPRPPRASGNVRVVDPIEHLPAGTREWRRAHPERPKLNRAEVARNYKAMNAEQIIENFEIDAATYHPKFNSPTDWLAQDYKAIKKAAERSLASRILADQMDALGIEASELKDMPDFAREIRKMARAQARATVKNIEDTVLREEWYDPAVKPLMGKGVQSRSDYQAGAPGPVGDAAPPQPARTPPQGQTIPTGSRALPQPQQPALPPAQPPPTIPPGQRGGPPAPQALNPRPRHYGDLFDADTPQAVRRQEVAFLDSPKGKVDTAIRKIAARFGGQQIDKNITRDTDVRPFVVKMRTMIQNKTNAYEGLADHLYVRATNAAGGVEYRNGAVVFKGTNAIVDDVMEGLAGIQTTPAAMRFIAQLQPEQRADLEELLEFNLALNGNLRFHGKDMNFVDPDIERSYFPRLVTGKDGVEKAYVGDGRAPLGSGAGFLKKRVHLSLQDGLDAGIDYADPRQAYRAMVRAKLRVAGDGYIENALKPLGLTEQQIRRQNINASNYTQIPPSLAPGLEGLWFKREQAERIVDALTQRSGTLDRAASAINSRLTPIRAVADISWAGQQGSALWFRHPVKAARAAKAVLMREFGRGPDADVHYLGLIDEEAARGPGLQELIRRGMHWVPEDVADIDVSFRQGGPRPWASVKDFSNRTYGRFLNYQRLVFANDAYERAMAMGLQEADFDKEIRGAMNAVNRMSGFTGRTPTSIERISVFAPRFLSSAVEQTAAAVSRGGLEGSIARAHMARMLGFGALTVFGINTLRGHETDFDPRSNNFLRIRDVGGLDVSLFGTYDTLFRAIAATAAGKSGEGPSPDVKRLWRFAEGKMSPAMKLIYEPFVKGATYNGEPLDPLGSWGGLAKTAVYQAQSSVPFSAQSIIEEGIRPAIEERDPRYLLEGGLSAAVSSTGLTSTPTTPTERRNWTQDELARAQFGRKYDDLTGAEKAVINRDPKVQKQQRRVDRNVLSQDTDRSRYRGVLLGAAAKIDELSRNLETGQISGNEWRQQYRQITTELRGAREALKVDGKSDSVIEGWFDLYDQAEGADGRIDWDMLEGLQMEYRARHPDVDERVLKIIGATDNETVAEYRKASEQARKYYQIPAYRRMSLEDSERAGRILGEAADMVTYGQARNIRAALAQIYRRDPDGVRLARRAQRAGTNPERQKFRRSNALMAKFYSDIVAQAA